MADLRLAIAGAGGRMGGALIRAAAEKRGVAIHSAFERAGSASVGQDAGVAAGVPPLGVAIGDDVVAALQQSDAVLDFTTPAASVALAQRAAAANLVHIVGTTGCGPDEDAAFRAAAEAGARIVKSGNFSLGINLLAAFVKKAAQQLEAFDIEILEMHHNRKVDAPSGTALLLGEAAASGRGVSLFDAAVRVRDGHTGPREPGTIGFATLRGGTVVGDHTVIFAGPSERIEFVHRADDRQLFANGALVAALWARDKPPGLYSMADVLGFADD